MASAVAELDAILQSMLAMKPPGVSQSKITSVTALCNANVQSESVLIQKIYTHFKKAPSTHKLGVLYVVDSVTRQWVEQARKAGQTTGSAAADGTFAAGVNRVTELLSSFMNDIINTAPEEQKARIRKLIDIWERGNTFPSDLLNTFKEKLSAHALQSTTPSGTPPQNAVPEAGNIQLGSTTAATAMSDTSTILANLQALANLSKQSAPPAAASGNPVQGSAGNVSFPQSPFQQTVPASVNPATSVATPVPAVNLPGAANAVFAYPGMNMLPQNFAPNPANGQSIMQAVPQQTMPVTDTVQQQVQILQALKAQGVPENQWPAVLSVLMAAGAGNPLAANAGPPQYGNFTAGRDDASRDQNGFDYPSYMRSPPNRNRSGRSRSRSPPGWDRRRDPTPPRLRDSPVYGEYGNDRNGGRGGGDRRGNARGKGASYRQRSPDRYRRSPSPVPPPGPKWIQYDHSIGQGMIKVLSRTLFVGGVTSSEDDLRAIFSTFGKVQTCIVNVDKRHAFVKMITREEAVRAKDGMEHYKSPEMSLRTRWGVGFGPRDCSDYQTGISIIPIDRLTDADRKWMLTAEYGGTGGKAIESGLVVEEPDIEIGAGVSSKAISRRMQTDKGGQQGPRSTRDPPSRFRQPDRKDGSDREDSASSTVNVPPAVPGFGFQIPTMPNGMPIFPPGFLMSSMASTPQPPPPGAT